MPIKRYRAVFLSPHLDDAVFSCGGTIALLARQGPVKVVNVFSVCPPSMRPGAVVPPEARASEEAKAADFLGFSTESMDEKDAALRRTAYRSPSRLFLAPVQDDIAWLPELATHVDARLDAIDCDVLYAPLGVGWHVDHVLCHAVARRRTGRNKILFYEDAPYCLLPHMTQARLRELGDFTQPRVGARGWLAMSRTLASMAPVQDLEPFPLRWAGAGVLSLYLARLLVARRRSRDPLPPHALRATEQEISGALDRKLQACAIYATQLRTFFRNEESAARRFRAHAIAAGTGKAVERFWEAPDARSSTVTEAPTTAPGGPKRPHPEGSRGI